jgi:hypothetical protein
MTATIVFSAREYRQGVQTILAACDEQLVGSVFEEGKLRLDVQESFYKGPSVDKETLAMMMAGCTIGNFVGESTIATAIEAGLISTDNVATVAGVPHAQMMLL